MAIPTTNTNTKALWAVLDTENQILCIPSIMRESTEFPFLSSTIKKSYKQNIIDRHHSNAFSKTENKIDRAASTTMCYVKVGQRLINWIAPIFQWFYICARCTLDSNDRLGNPHLFIPIFHFANFSHCVHITQCKSKSINRKWWALSFIFSRCQLPM